MFPCYVAFLSTVLQSCLEFQPPVVADMEDGVERGERDFLKVGILEGRKNKSILGVTFLISKIPILSILCLINVFLDKLGKSCLSISVRWKMEGWMDARIGSLVRCVKSVSRLLARLGACSRGGG